METVHLLGYQTRRLAQSPNPPTDYRLDAGRVARLSCFLLPLARAHGAISPLSQTSLAHIKFVIPFGNEGASHTHYPVDAHSLNVHKLVHPFFSIISYSFCSSVCLTQQSMCVCVCVVHFSLNWKTEIHAFIHSSSKKRRLPRSRLLRLLF
jgi:hypothetical protein